MCLFYWHKIICRYRLPRAIILDNGIQFASTMVTEFFFKYLRVQTKFIFVVHPQANGKAELVNTIILKGVKKKLNDAKFLWVELLHEVL